jgi:hypothetical protein
MMARFGGREAAMFEAARITTTWTRPQSIANRSRAIAETRGVVVFDRAEYSSMYVMSSFENAWQSCGWVTSATLHPQ